MNRAADLSTKLVVLSGGVIELLAAKTFPFEMETIRVKAQKIILKFFIKFDFVDFILAIVMPSNDFQFINKYN